MGARPRHGRPGRVDRDPGLGGGLLSEQLTLTVADVTEPAHPRTVYSGPLASMPDQAAGRVEAGDSRTYEFTATLPEAGPAVDQNAFQGAATSVAYAWTATEAGAAEGGEGPGARGRARPPLAPARRRPRRGSDPSRSPAASTWR